MKLTRLARKAIENYFEGIIFDPDTKTKQKYKAKKACFITLTKKGNLRGCVGSLQAYQSLYKDVISNAINAAFRDYRFKPLDRSEFSDINIEISVLTDPKSLPYKNEDELLKKINSNMGLILQKGSYSSTFLPQVWEEIPDKINFLEQLSLKAGLNKGAWKKSQFQYYKIKSQKE